VDSTCIARRAADAAPRGLPSGDVDRPVSVPARRNEAHLPRPSARPTSRQNCQTATASRRRAQGRAAGLRLRPPSTRCGQHKDRRASFARAAADNVTMPPGPDARRRASATSSRSGWRAARRELRRPRGRRAGATDRTDNVRIALPWTTHSRCATRVTSWSSACAAAGRGASVRSVVEDSSDIRLWMVHVRMPHGDDVEGGCGARAVEHDAHLGTLVPRGCFRVASARSFTSAECRSRPLNQNESSRSASLGAVMHEPDERGVVPAQHVAATRADRWGCGRSTSLRSMVCRIAM